MEDLLDFTHTIDEEDSQYDTFDQRRPTVFDGVVLQDVTKSTAQRKNKESNLPSINQNLAIKDQQKIQDTENRMAKRISKVKGMKEAFLKEYFVKDIHDVLEPGNGIDHNMSLYSTSKKIQDRIVEKQRCQMAGSMNTKYSNIRIGHLYE